MDLTTKTVLKILFSDETQSDPNRPIIPPSYSYDSMPDVESIPAYGQPSYSANRRREKRELVPGYGQTSVQSKCIEPPRNLFRRNLLHHT